MNLEEHYRETLRVLGQQGGMLGLIFRKAQNKIQDPAKKDLDCCKNSKMKGCST